MAESVYCPTAAEKQLAACNRAYGWPAPAYPFGAGTPEGNVIGYYPGMLYADTENETLWAFFGTAGEATGWVDLTA